MPQAAPDIDRQLALLQRGTEAIYTADELRRKLASGRRLRIKLGMDPTAPDIHLGHTVVLRKMRQFQDLGHKAVLIIGDYTARIGDPTGQDQTRPVLSPDEIEQNARTYLDQAGAILDLSEDRFELRYNSEWLDALSLGDVLKLTAHFTVQQMLHRESFRRRMEADRQILVTEFMYPLMQAYDSVAIGADVELGGTDQTFNNLRGRDLMGRHDLEAQAVLIMPILTGLDGSEKMSKSKGNAVPVRDEPDEMFGKLMSIPDELMGGYLRLLTPVEEDRIAALTDPSQTHPRQAKDELARAIVAQFHGQDAAEAASKEFERRFRERQLPNDIETFTIAGDASGEANSDGGFKVQKPIINIVVEVGFANSKSEARRLISQGAVKLAGEKITDSQTTVTVPEEPTVLQVGKRRVCQIVAGA